MRIIYLFVATLVLSIFTAAASHSKQPSDILLKYYFKSGGVAKLLVVEVDEMIGSDWTCDNPPKAKVKVLRSLVGTMPEKGNIVLVWNASPPLLCGNDPFAGRIWERWKSRPLPGYVKGDRQIVIALPDKTNANLFKTMINDVVPYSVAVEKKLMTRINELRSGKAKP